MPRHVLPPTLVLALGALGCDPAAIAGLDHQALDLASASAPDARAPVLIIVDGKVASSIQLRAIEAGTISRIEVLKGPAALKLYGERGAGGVIHIFLKSDREP